MVTILTYNKPILLMMMQTFAKRSYVAIDSQMACSWLPSHVLLQVINTNSCNKIFMAYLLTVANYGEHPYPATAIDTVIFGFDLLITAINSMDIPISLSSRTHTIGYKPLSYIMIITITTITPQAKYIHYSTYKHICTLKLYPYIATCSCMLLVNSYFVIKAKTT